MLNMAEAAGISKDDADSNWGRTFMRWAWPFGGETSESTNPEALLEQGFEEDISANDPWWWPLWSEKHTLPSENQPEADISTDEGVDPASEASPETNTPDAAENESASESTDESNPTKATNDQNRSKAKDAWFWPF